jgi:MraZ protein
MFASNANNSIDETGRMFMPAKYCGEFDVAGSAEDAGAVDLSPVGKLRKNYAGKCVIVRGAERYLNVYPIRIWERRVNGLRALPSDDDRVRDWIRHFVGTSAFCDIDKQGRLTIPQELRNYAGLMRELACVGAIETLEIWDRVTYEHSEANKDFKDISNYVSKLEREQNMKI